MSKRQNYNNRGRSFRALLAAMGGFMSRVWNSVFHNNRRNTGRAGGHLDTSYYSMGGSGGDTKKEQRTKQFRSKEKQRKYDKRKQVQYTKRMNRKRAAGVCSFK